VRRPSGETADGAVRTRSGPFPVDLTAVQPQRPSIFTNSDPALIRFFLRFLDVTGTPRSDLRFRVSIHEKADVEAAQQFWIDVTGATASQFFTPTLKRHNPVTVRKNVGETYHGCLRIDVKRSADLYRRIEGWSEAITSGG
jgi:hypothetical protein